MAACIAVTVVSRSSTTVEMDTFMTVPSSTITNWADPRIATTDHLFIFSPASDDLRRGTSGHPGRWARTTSEWSIRRQYGSGCPDAVETPRRGFSGAILY